MKSDRGSQLKNFKCCSNEPTDEGQGQTRSKTIIYCCLRNLSMMSSCYSNCRKRDWLRSYGRKTEPLWRKFPCFGVFPTLLPPPQTKIKILCRWNPNIHGFEGFVKIWLKSVLLIRRKLTEKTNIDQLDELVGWLGRPGPDPYPIFHMGCGSGSGLPDSLQVTRFYFQLDTLWMFSTDFT